MLDPPVMLKSVCVVTMQMIMQLVFKDKTGEKILADDATEANPQNCKAFNGFLVKFTTHELLHIVKHVWTCGIHNETNEGTATVECLDAQASLAEIIVTD